MSKFCKNCGTELADTAAFCKNCGTSVVSEAAPEQVTADYSAVDNSEYASEFEQPTVPVAKESGFVGAVNNFINKIKNKDTTALLITGGVALSLVIFLVLAIVFAGGGAEDAVDNYFKVAFKCKSGAVEDLAPEAYWEYLEDKANIDVEDIEDFVDDKDYRKLLESTFKQKVGKDVSFSYDIVETDEVGKNDFDDIKDTLKNNYDIAKKDIEDAVEIVIEITAEGDDDEEESEMKIIAVKIDGDWYPCDTDGTLLVNSLVLSYSLIDAGGLKDQLNDLEESLGDLSNILG